MISYYLLVGLCFLLKYYTRACTYPSAVLNSSDENYLVSVHTCFHLIYTQFFTILIFQAM